MKKLVWIFSFFLALPIAAQAAGGPSIELEPAQNNLRDQDSLKRGAILFSNYCMACHSMKYMRYNRIARDIGWSNEEIVEKMAYNMNKVVDDVKTRMLPGVAMEVLGVEPPDLSLMARLRGTDYIYTFLRGYYQDENGKWDNHALAGTSMPNVLEGIQRHASAEDYAQAARDIANFMEYAGEPAKLQRTELGWKVIAFLLVLLVLTYFLKKEYWRDIKH
ncbi:cytochrome c1 [Thiomicrorhabdus sp. ZW0627]|uniref:cytochrome c1 n=1 Tax=Thiomicrorhabdus sp. ZW0627 TaxID=3039774 RepID=UPI0024373B02|nr:cytochrome c1 [Thiomicrorhabdus sp. ZW0627]MDG6773563.1 cytochrome c1 [Thiomicrorhabdus sp. ZW0627]